jgi:hypothetical protein
MRLLLLLSLILIGSSAQARESRVVRQIAPIPGPSQLCMTAIGAAERAQRTPARLLAAIARVESGRPDARGAVQPWPWTINAEGAGHFFESKAEAVAAVEALQARGVRSIDVGCMQVNLMHHPHAFASLDEAFDPEANAAYGARFLSALHRDLGAWPAATAAYHSQTAGLGTDYARKVMVAWGHPELAPRDRQPAFAALAVSTEQYRAFAPQSMLFGAFTDPATLRNGLDGYSGLPAGQASASAAGRGPIKRSSSSSRHVRR